MKYWSESIDDAFSCFQWFSKEEAKEKNGYVPEISVFSMVGSRIFSLGDQDSFIHTCSDSFVRFVRENERMDSFRFYLFGVNETDNDRSKIFKYKKLWKTVDEKFDLQNFLLGPEVENTDNGTLSYASIAEFKVIELYKAVQIMKSNPTKYVIFAGRKQEYMNESFIKSLTDTIYINQEIDYFKLALAFSDHEELLFRWGTSSTECELDIIMHARNIRMFDSFVLGSLFK